MTSAEPIVTVERHIKASPQTVFSFFTDRDKWLSWQGVSAEIDPRPGGIFRMEVRDNTYASGRFVVVQPYERISFTWGWEDEASGLAPGSSTVEVTLQAIDGGTMLRLIHFGLSLPLADLHRLGWNHYLDRLAIRIDGGDPGPDLPF